MRSKKYFDFYRELSNQGCTVIMDNGAYEGEQLSDDALLKLVMDFEPDIVVLPDKPGQLGETVRRSMRFKKILEAEDIEVETWFVLHAESCRIEDFIASYDIGCMIADGLCFSKLTSAYSPTMHGITRRVKFAQLLKDEGIWKKDKVHHALGMLDGNLEEIPQLAKQGFDSIDSSAPCWHPMNGYKTQDIHWPGYELKMDTSTEFSEVNINDAKKSMAEVQQLCQSTLK